MKIHDINVILIDSTCVQITTTTLQSLDNKMKTTEQLQHCEGVKSSEEDKIVKCKLAWGP